MSLRKCCLLLAALVLVWGAWCLSPVQPEHTLRLHVIANSDSPQDQAAKLRVRDAILAYEAQGLDTRSQEALRTDILADGAGLLSTVEASLRESGMDYGARLSLGPMPSPTVLTWASVIPPAPIPPCGWCWGRALGKIGGAYCFLLCAYWNCPAGKLKRERCRACFSIS